MLTGMIKVIPTYYDICNYMFSGCVKITVFCTQVLNVLNVAFVVEPRWLII